jgi:hypothetical protein
MFLRIKYATFCRITFTFSVLVTSLFCFSFNKNYLFLGLDGKYIYLVLRDRGITFLYQPLSAFSFKWNLLQGLGSIGLVSNPAFMPSFWPVAAGGDFEKSIVLSFTLLSLELTLCSYLLCRRLGLGSFYSMFASSLVLISMLPYRTLPALYVMTSLAPPFGSLMCQCCFFIYLFSKITAARTYDIALKFLAASFLVTSIIFMNPVSLTISGPICTIYMLSIIIFDRENRKIKILFVGGLLLLLGVSTIIPFVVGLNFNTAAVLAAGDIPDARVGPKFMSIFFNPNIYGDMYQLGFYLFVFAFIGCSISLFARDSITRAIAAATFLLMCMFVLLGEIARRHPDFNSMWRGAAPLYYELMIIPIYAGLAFRGLQVVLLVLAGFLGRSIARFDRIMEFQFYYQRGIRACGILISAVLFPAMLFSVPIPTDLFDRDIPASFYKMPPDRNTIVDILEKEIALSPVKIYNGRVASLFGSGNSDVFDASIWQKYQKAFEGSLGNDLMTVGMWYYKIPTLLVYNPLMSPALFRFTRAFLSEPQDIPDRNIPMLRKFDARILRLLGVKFVISDQREAIGTDARFIVALSEPSGKTANLFELDRVNTQGFSPTNLRTIRSWAETMSVLADPTFDLEKNSTTDRELAGPFEAVTESRIVVSDSKIFVTAKSHGRSLLILPFEFSNCMVVAGGRPDMSVFRADGLLLGLSFERSLDISVETRFGLGRRSLCRFQDAMEHRHALQ